MNSAEFIIFFLVLITLEKEKVFQMKKHLQNHYKGEENVSINRWVVNQFI